jgi:hypothetical protein
MSPNADHPITILILLRERRIGTGLGDRNRGCAAGSIFPVDLNDFCRFWQSVVPRAESNPCVQRGIGSPGANRSSAARNRESDLFLEVNDPGETSDIFPETNLTCAGYVQGFYAGLRQILELGDLFGVALTH